MLIGLLQAVVCRTYGVVSGFTACYVPYRVPGGTEVPSGVQGKMSFQQLSCKIREFCYLFGPTSKKFGHFDNFSGKYHAKIRALC